MNNQQMADALWRQYVRPLLAKLKDWGNPQELANTTDYTKFAQTVCGAVDALDYEKCALPKDWVHIVWPKRRAIVALWSYYGRDMRNKSVCAYIEEIKVLDGTDPRTTSFAGMSKPSPEPKASKLVDLERSEWLYNQYGLTIENDAKMRRELEVHIREGSFHDFSDAVRTFMDKTRRSLHPEDIFNFWDYESVRIDLWEYLEGSQADKTYVSAYKNFYASNRPNEAKPQKDQDIMNEISKAAMSAEYGKIGTASLCSNIPVKTVTYIYGRAVGDMSTDSLIDAVKQVEAEIEALSKVKTQSTKIKAMIGDLELALAEIVKALDAS